MVKSKTKEQLVNELAEMRLLIEQLEQERKQAAEEKEYLLEQLRQIRELEDIGKLADGIVHDFNNILGNIIGYTELALTHYVSPESPTYGCLEEVLHAAEKAKNLVAKIATIQRRFAQKQKSAK